MDFPSSLHDIFTYLHSPSPVDDNQLVMDLLKEQILTGSASLHETVQAVLDINIGDHKLVAGADFLGILKESLDTGSWPPVIESIDYRSEVDDDINLYKHVKWLKCFEAANDLGRDRFSSTAIASVVTVVLTLTEPHSNDCEELVTFSESDSFAPFVLSILDTVLKTSALCKPCRHFMHGNCLLANCSFSHDLASVPCRHWLSPGGCLYECSCPFGHGDDVLLFTANDAIARLLETATVEVNTECNQSDNFPSLPSTSSSSRPKAPKKLATFDLLDKFVFKTKRGSISSGETFVESMTKPVVVSKSQHVPLDDWIEGGKVVAAQYAMMREEAGLLARARNALFEKATSFYRAGKGSEARKASQEGHAINAQLHEHQCAAAKAIFSARNSAESIRRGVLDLHGLHVSEADTCLRSILPQLAKSGLRKASVLTGSGHHSTGYGRLQTVVQSIAAELNLPLSTLSDANGHCGGYCIDLLSLV